GRAPGGEPLDELLAQTSDDLAAAPVVEREQQDDQAAGGHAAERAVTLDEDRVGACAGGGRGRRDSRRAAACDEDVALRDDGQVAGLLPVGRAGAHTAPRTDAASRCFCTLPTAVRGSSGTNAIVCGRLNAASAVRQWARISSLVGRSPSRTT